MAGNLLNKYGTNNQAITCTFTSLANNGQRQSTVVATGNNAIDAMVFVTVKTNASGTSSTGFVNVYAYGSVDGGSNYSDGATGSDGTITLTGPANMRLIGTVNAVANATTYKAGPFAVSLAFGGVLPDHWGIVIENKTGATLDASVGAAIYQEIEGQYT